LVYNDENAIFINEIEFCIDRFIFLPQIRPHKFEKAVMFSGEYCQVSDFQRKMLEKFMECPFLIFHYIREVLLSFLNSSHF